ncbi:hypothetical protein [Methanobrevibacter millerae]|nr:hypothetical protein [Methanobrevibacter millerae]
MIKKFMIIILFAFFMISAVSASEIDEAVFSDHAEVKIQEFAKVNQIDVGEEITVDDIVEDDVVIGEDNHAPTKYNQEYNDCIINNPESYNEIENNQYNYTNIKALIVETWDNDTNLDLHDSIVSVHIFNDFLDNFEVICCMKLDSSFKIIHFSHDLSNFKNEINKFKVLTHEDLIFYNNYYNVLTSDVEKCIISSSDKLHTKFAFSIDNSVVGGADSFIYNILNSNFSNFNSFSLSFFQTFSNFAIIFNTNYYEYFFSE